MPHVLIDLATSHPERAEATSERMLAYAGSSRTDRVIAHQARAIAWRIRGRLDEAIAELRRALRIAVRVDDRVLLSDVTATYGATLVVGGRVRAGLAQLDHAIALDDSALNRLRRGTVRNLVGQYEGAYHDLLRASAGFRDEGERTWEAHALHNLGWVALSWGRLDDATRHTADAESAWVVAGRDIQALWARQNLGEIALVRGDLVGALRTFEEVAAGFRAHGHRRPHLAFVRCRAFLAAGLYDEAAATAHAELDAGAMEPADTAGLRLLAARAHLEAGEHAVAADLARAAVRAFRQLNDEPWEIRSRFLVVTIKVAQGGRGVALAREATTVATGLEADRAEETPSAWVTAARLGGGKERLAQLERAAAHRTRGSSLVRAAGWLAQALAKETLDDRGGVLRACGRGFDALDEHRRFLGSTELRALATGHGTELASLALRHAARRPRDLLGWSERWRSTALAQIPITPGAGRVDETLAALRDAHRRIEGARLDGEPTEDLERERIRLERQVRAEQHLVVGAGDGQRRAGVEEIVAGVGEGLLVELVDVDGDLHVLVVHNGRVRRRVAGTTAEALALADSARFMLRRAARGRPFAPGDLGQRLQQILFGDSVRLIPDGPLVVVPTARLHGVPWSLLPRLTDRPFSIAPSAAQWLRASRTRSPRSGEVAVIAGPGLGTGGAEVPVLAKRMSGAVHLSGADATVEAAMGALDGARLAHIAAHGTFRADSPLFSALQLADGPLTVHDLERLTKAPHRVVLSACDSGVLAPVGAEELLGLASALFALGTAGLVCSVAEVNDEATAALMVHLHGELARGLTPAEALHRVRQGADGDLHVASAAAFLALGA
jgi:tetratricopeptide (TPR) repeat protein